MTPKSVSRREREWARRFSNMRHAATGMKMSAAIPIRMAGYGPPTTGFSKALKFIGDKLQAQFGDRVAIDYVWNIMDHGHKAEDILTLVENGEIHARLPVVELSHRPRAGTGLRRSAVSVRQQRAGARGDGRRARRHFSRRRPRSASITASSAGSRTASATSPTGCARSTCRPISRA